MIACCLAGVGACCVGLLQLKVNLDLGIWIPTGSSTHSNVQYVQKHFARYIRIPPAAVQ